MVSVAWPRVNAGCHLDGGSVRGSPTFPGKVTEIPQPRLDRHCRRPVSVYARSRRGPRGSGSDRLDPGNRSFPRDMGFRQPVGHAAAMSPTGSRSRPARKGLDRFPAGERV